MNNQLIEKVIRSSGVPCPEFAFENPLLDSNVSEALSKSFINSLNLSQQNSNVSNNLRVSILENMRKLCRIEPENHFKIEESLTNLLSAIYVENIAEPNDLNPTESMLKTLDAFIMRRAKEMDISSCYETPVNPESIQALINLNKNELDTETLFQDSLHWKSSNTHIELLKNMWTNESDKKLYVNLYDDMSIKLKSEIEKLLLETCELVFNDRELDIEDIFHSNADLKNLIDKSSNSAECFQICAGILNFLFNKTNFDGRIQEFVKIFVGLIKDSCLHTTISVLYPQHMSHIVVLMDVDIDKLPVDIKDDYIDSTMKYLTKLKSQNDIFLLLSHFSNWLDLYSNYKINLTAAEDIRMSSM